MDNWHIARCARPDVTFVPDLGVPVCGSCGEICPAHNAGNKHNDELLIPSASKRSAMQLKWPPSMSYQKDAYSEDPDGSLHKSLASLLDQEKYDKEADNPASCSSVIKTAQTPSPKVIKTSYESLDGTKIRVLRLHKGRFGDCLHGDFEIVSLQNQDAESEEPATIPTDGEENATSYEAVSYTWAKGNGRREKDHAIFIANRWDVLPITENCYDALQNCRFDDQDRLLWVDAICINQSNISERTHQVGMMRRIYSTASCVLIYLETGDTGGGSEITDDPRILSSNPYFSRIWVVQEIASAKQALVLYDRKAMHWDFFHGNLRHFSFERWMRHFGSPGQIDDAYGFLALLRDTQNCNASDPRDKIFALLGLWKKWVEPNYTLSPQAVYTGLASILVTDKRWEVVAQLLDMAAHGPWMPGLPSWVPNWSEKSPQSSLPTEIDILAQYLFRGFRSITDGMVTVEAGCFQLSLAPEVLQICEPTDSIFRLSQNTFCLILRKKADPNIYSFIGLCRYTSTGNSERGVNAIRYILDWGWLFSLRQKQPWSELSTWADTQVCWLALRQQKKVQTRLFLQRVVRKAQFLQKIRNLAEDAKQALSSNSRDKPLLKEFFKRQWRKIYKLWRKQDERIVVDHQARRALIRKLLPGYSSLEPLRDTTTQDIPGQSMWLPVSSFWLAGMRTVEEPNDRYTEHRLLVDCVSRNIPLPPLHLIRDKKSHIDLSLQLGLENGLRQLQRLAREHLLEDMTAREMVLESYNLQRSHSHDFREKEWAIFLHWLARPMSPSYEALKDSLSRDIPLIWEGGLETRAQLDKTHAWLDDNFNHYITALSSSPRSESSLNKIFELIYREQFELLWILFFHSDSAYTAGLRDIPRDKIGAEVARSFFWRFDRSIKKAYRVVGNRCITHDETMKLWTKFLDWLKQPLFEEQAREVPSKVYYDRPRLLVDEENSDDRYGVDTLNRIKRKEVLIVPKTEEYVLEMSMRASRLSHTRSYTRRTLSELVQSEIWRRRLPERVFAFLFEDTETTIQPTQPDDRSLEEMLANGQSYNCGGPSVQAWRQETAFWKDVEQYVSKSEWHMSCIKMELLGESKEEKDMYKEIVII
ncbi:heterokaryon incompatibility het-6 [Fusarium pseudoanthophilum]|uniref:Heterokaryon incompatibility het-6 n=1 Tax=Fusarium pseudoanthophilum TaxID=48495 RepID=A0A8H5UNN8_9HYPO|nr:heterokaryon incompatibility het-6 [Fusarium pseudoanthophilum]